MDSYVLEQLFASMMYRLPFNIPTISVSCLRVPSTDHDPDDGDKDSIDADDGDDKPTDDDVIITLPESPGRSPASDGDMKVNKRLPVDLPGKDGLSLQALTIVVVSHLVIIYWPSLLTLRFADCAVDVVSREATPVNGAAASDELSCSNGHGGGSNSNANNKNKKKKKGAKAEAAQKSESSTKVSPTTQNQSEKQRAQTPSTVKRNKVTITASDKVKVAASQAPEAKVRTSGSANSLTTTPRNKIQSNSSNMTSSVTSSADKRLVDRNNSRNKEQSNAQPKATAQSKKNFTATSSTGARRSFPSSLLLA